MFTWFCSVQDSSEYQVLLSFTWKVENSPPWEAGMCDASGYNKINMMKLFDSSLRQPAINCLSLLFLNLLLPQSALILLLPAFSFDYPSRICRWVIQEVKVRLHPDSKWSVRQRSVSELCPPPPSSHLHLQRSVSHTCRQAGNQSGVSAAQINQNHLFHF